LRHDPKAAREPYEGLVRAIAYQQLTAKAGDAMIDRLKDLAGSVFPTAAQIVAFGPGELRACGFSAAKAATIQAIAQSALSGVVPTRAAADQMDDEALITRLVSIKGVGRWTVEMLLMYPLERMDVLPASDFGVREGYRVLKALPEQPKPAALRELAQMWSPHRTVAAWYLWRIPRARSGAGRNHFWNAVPVRRI
jgi:DNA-3-methyladenine glycosylase II